MHTFCQFCINVWKMNRAECPQCRNPITSEGRNLVVDNMIEAMLANMSEEVQKRRKELVESRKALVVSQEEQKRSSRNRNGGRRPRQGAAARSPSTFLMKLLQFLLMRWKQNIAYNSYRIFMFKFNGGLYRPVIPLKCQLKYQLLVCLCLLLLLLLQPLPMRDQGQFVTHRAKALQLYRLKIVVFVTLNPCMLSHVLALSDFLRLLCDLPPILDSQLNRSQPHLVKLPLQFHSTPQSGMCTTQPLLIALPSPGDTITKPILFEDPMCS